MSCNRIKPYSHNSMNYRGLLLCKLFIPMNQREYSWENNEIKTFLDDIINLFENTQYKFKLGSIINLKNNGDADEIYDGQQRTLTTSIILYCLSKLCSELKGETDQLLINNSKLYKLNERCSEIQRKLDVKFMPKIECINPYDMNALTLIFNNKVDLFVNYIKNFNDFKDINDLIEKTKYVSTMGDNISFSTKSDFKKHLISKYDYNKYLDALKISISSSNLYNAYEYIYNYLKFIKYDNDKYIELWKFILDDTDIMVYSCDDPNYVSRIFDWENNRGKKVFDLDIIKNPLLVSINDDKKLEIYKKWEDYKKLNDDIFKIIMVKN